MIDTMGKSLEPFIGASLENHLEGETQKALNHWCNLKPHRKLTLTDSKEETQVSIKESQNCWDTSVNGEWAQDWGNENTARLTST